MRMFYGIKVELFLPSSSNQEDKAHMLNRIADLPQGSSYSEVSVSYSAVKALLR